MSWPPVLEFLELWKSEPNMLQGAPEIWHSHEIEAFSRPKLGEHKSPFVVLAKLNYQSGSLEDAVQGWKPVVAYAQAKERGVLTYTLGKDMEHQNRITLVEAYESEQYLREVHFKSAPVQQKLQEEEHLRVGEPDVVFLKHVAGYWFK
jgi:quinol monooxygenase YgiN